MLYVPGCAPRFLHKARSLKVDSLIVDLGDVAYLSSAFIGKLVAVFKSISTVKGRMIVAGVRPSLMPLFQVTRIDKIIAFEPVVEKAILLYKRKPL